MKNIIHFLIFLIIIIPLQGCEKEIDIKYKDIDPILVIEGQLTQNGANVRLTYTTPMDEPMNVTPITDADVFLKDLTDGTLLQLHTSESGTFTSESPGIVGHNYELSVIRGNSHYCAECEMAGYAKILNVEFNWIKMPYDDVAVLQVTFLDNPLTSGECYWVRLYRNGEAYMWNLITDVYSKEGVINEVFMTSRKDLDEEDDATALRDGDVVTASVSVISREMYDYLEAVSSDSNGPAMYGGDFCLGYFLATQISEESIVFKPDLIPYF